MSESGRRYRILGVLGKGGFGTVYRAELQAEGGFKRQVALKVLNPEMSGKKDVAARMRDEARLLGLLRHRAILQVDGLVKLNNRWTIVMEFIEGPDLQRLVRGSGPVPLGPALEIISEVAGALHVAYTWEQEDGSQMKLLHRDIKPPNILLTSAGETKVLDFGIARAEFGGREAMTRSVLYGSVGYMAPERLDLEELPEGDVYALGTVLFELLDGEPFGKASVHPQKHADLITTGLARIVEKTGLPDDVRDLLASMLAYDPENRPNSREVERRTRTLRSQVGGPWLRDWAEQTVPPLLAGLGQLEQDEFTGSILVESGSIDPAIPSGDIEPVGPAPETMGFGLDEIEPPPRSNGGRNVLLALGSMGCLGIGGIGLAVALGLLVVAAAGGSVYYQLSPTPTPPSVSTGPATGPAPSPKPSSSKTFPLSHFSPPPKAVSERLSSDICDPFDSFGIDTSTANIMYCSTSNGGYQGTLSLQYAVSETYDKMDIARALGEVFVEQGFHRKASMNAGGAATQMLDLGQKQVIVSVQLLRDPEPHYIAQVVWQDNTETF